MGMVWMMQPGTYDEIQQGVPAAEASWSVAGKVTMVVLFSSTGLFSSSCAAAITKHFGALAMSITSTARKATTLFLSFFLFNNVCTSEHIVGVIIFISALTVKTLRRRNVKSTAFPPPSMNGSEANLELQYLLPGNMVSNLTQTMERTPKKSPRRLGRSPSTPDCIVDTRLEDDNFHLTKPVERGTPVRASRSLVQAPTNLHSDLDKALTENRRKEV